MTQKTFALYTLGCKVNQEEGAAVGSLMESAGFRRVDFSAPADLYIINTCTVTNMADRKSRQMIRRAAKANPRAVIVVTGCYAQTSPDDVAQIEEVDIVAGMEERAVLPQLVDELLRQREKDKSAGRLLSVADIMKARDFIPIPADASGQERVRAYLKIEDGCDQFCHYCVVPYARGPVRSLPFDAALQQARILLAEGHQEIVLTGIHIGAYGQDLPGDIDIVDLAQELIKLPGLLRLRFGSVEPQQISERFLELMGQEKICAHLHIPLQSGCDAVLKAMGRRYNTAFYRQIIECLRQAVPDIAVTTDVIVGYPGETAEDFAATCDFCRRMVFARMHVFPYSPRRRTVAADLPDQVGAQEKNKRAELLSRIGEDLADKYRQSFIGRRLQVLAEQRICWDGKWYWQGHSDQYLQVIFPLEAGEQGKAAFVWGREALGERLFADIK